jgi:hypothetical protein
LRLAASRFLGRVCDISDAAVYNERNFSGNGPAKLLTNGSRGLKLRETVPQNFSQAVLAFVFRRDFQDERVRPMTGGEAA